MIETVQIPHHGRVVSADLYTPESEKQYPVVILSHGYGGHQSDFAALGTLLAENGFGALSITFCGGSHHDTPGFATEKMTLFTEKEDLCAALDYVKALPQTTEVFLFGASQGGIVSAMTAAARKGEVRALMLKYPAFCIPDDWNAKYPEGAKIEESFDFWGIQLGRGFVEALRGYDVWSDIAAYEGPVMIWHGAKDAVVALRYSEKAAALYGDVQLKVYPEEGHGFQPEASAEVNREAVAFVKKIQETESKK